MIGFGKWRFTLIIFLLFVLNGVRGQTVLYPGDIALLTLNSDGLKNFEFISLVDIVSGTTIHFTDDAWIEETNSFRGSEGILTYTASQNIASGSIISCPTKDGGNGFTESGSFNPSASGDNIIVYQNSIQNPVFIYGAGWARGFSVWEYSTISSSYKSDIPPGLSADNYTISSLGTKDNYQYNINNGNSGKAVNILKLLSNTENYNSNNSDAFQSLSSVFNVENSLTVATGDNLSWENASWSSGLPDESMDVIIDANINIETNATCRDLTINDDKALEISSGSVLYVKRRIVNNGGNEGIIIHSDANNNGAIINNENVNGTYRLFIEKDQWHFVSSPINENLSINDLFGLVQGDLFGIFSYDEESASWISSSGANVIKHKGYNLYYENQDKFLEFSGELSSYPSKQDISISKTDNNGWNLIGNPFPSSIDWGSEENTDSKGWYKQTELVENKTIYITTGGSNGNTSFAIYNGNSGIGIPDNNVRYISPGQAFWVRALTAGNLEINNKARTIEPSQFKSYIPGIFTIRIKIQTANYNDQTVICYINNAIENYGIYDSEKLSNRNGNCVEIFSTSINKDLAINALPISQETSQIQLGYYSSIQEEAEIKINLINKYSNSVELILKDNYENNSIEISDEKSYSFYTNIGEFTDRFVLEIRQPELLIPEIKNNNIDADIFLDDDLLHINIKTQFKQANYFAYNINGLLIQSGKLFTQGINQIDASFKPGIYIINIIVDGERMVRKVIST